MERAPPEHLGFFELYMRMGLGMIKQSEFTKELIAMGYDVHGHGSSEGGHIEAPDLTQYMPEIIDAFTGFLRENLPSVPGMEEFFNEERINGINREVRDHLSDHPPNFAAVLAMAGEMNLDKDVQEGMMMAFKSFMN